jgi:hypothetical protein
VVVSKPKVHVGSLWRPWGLYSNHSGDGVVCVIRRTSIGAPSSLSTTEVRHRPGVQRHPESLGRAFGSADSSASSSRNHRSVRRRQSPARPQRRSRSDELRTCDASNTYTRRYRPRGRHSRAAGSQGMTPQLTRQARLGSIGSSYATKGTNASGSLQRHCQNGRRDARAIRGSPPPSTP